MSVEFLDNLVDNVIVRPGVAAFIQNDKGELLYEQRADCGLWGLPGGRIDPGESVLEACEREVYEETGLVVQYEKLVGIYTGLNHKFPLRKYPDNVVQVLEIIVKCTIISGELTCSSESLQLEFYPEHFPPDPLFPGNEVFLNDFLNNKIGIL